MQLLSLVLLFFISTFTGEYIALSRFLTGSIDYHTSHLLMTLKRPLRLFSLSSKLIH